MSCDANKGNVINANGCQAAAPWFALDLAQFWAEAIHTTWLVDDPLPPGWCRWRDDARHPTTACMGGRAWWPPEVVRRGNDVIKINAKSLDAWNWRLRLTYSSRITRSSYRLRFNNYTLGDPRNATWSKIGSWPDHTGHCHAWADHTGHCHAWVVSNSETILVAQFCD